MSWEYFTSFFKEKTDSGEEQQESKRNSTKEAEEIEICLLEQENFSFEDELKTNKKVKEELYEAKRRAQREQKAYSAKISDKEAYLAKIKSMREQEACEAQRIKEKEDVEQLLLTISTLKKTKDGENSTKIMEKEIEILNEIDKSIVKVEENGSEKILFGSLNEKVIECIISGSEETLSKLDEIENKDIGMANKILTTVIQTVPKEEEIALNKATGEEIEKGINSLKSESILMSCLKKRIEENKENKVMFSKQSSIKSQVSMKLICCKESFRSPIHYSENVKLSDSSSFEDLFINNEKLAEFTDSYIKNFSEQFSIPKSSIKVTSIEKDSAIVYVEVSPDFADNVNKVNSETNQLTLHPYFQYFCLALDDFSPKDDFNFPKKTAKGNIETRGGWPYFQPVNCTRYALNVSKKYDNGKDDWLMMDGRKGEWAVAFHGVTAPDKYCSNASGAQLKIMNSIMEGREKGEMLRAGDAQAYSSSVACNQAPQKVDNGIYCSPMIQIPISGYSGSGVVVNNKKYFLVLQCRVNPSKIKVCPKNEYWVINESKDIRPYGIILLDESEKKSYPSTKSLYEDESFNWNKYKDKIKVL